MLPGKLFIKNCTESHENPKHGVAADTTSQTDGRTDKRGLYIKLSFLIRKERLISA